MRFFSPHEQVHALRQHQRSKVRHLQKLLEDLSSYLNFNTDPINIKLSVEKFHLPQTRREHLPTTPHSKSHSCLPRFNAVTLTSSRDCCSFQRQKSRQTVGLCCDSASVSWLHGGANCSAGGDEEHKIKINESVKEREPQIRSEV